MEKAIQTHAARPVYSNHLDDEVDSDQLVVNKELSSGVVPREAWGGRLCVSRQSNEERRRTLTYPHSGRSPERDPASRENDYIILEILSLGRARCLPILDEITISRT